MIVVLTHNLVLKTVNIDDRDKLIEKILFMRKV